MSLNLFICKIVANPASAWFQLGAHSAGFSAEGWFIFSNLPPFLQLVAEIDQPKQNESCEMYHIIQIIRGMNI